MSTPAPFDIALAALLHHRADDALASARAYDAMPGRLPRVMARRCQRLALKNRYQASLLAPVAWAAAAAEVAA